MKQKCTNINYNSLKVFINSSYQLLWHFIISDESGGLEKEHAAQGGEAEGEQHDNCGYSQVLIYCLCHF